MVGLRDKKKENTRKKIQEKALQLFEVLGYEKTTMNKIASVAEIGVGTLYNYYPSKAELLFSIIEGNLETHIADFEEIIKSKTPLLEALIEFFDIYFKSFNTYGRNVWRDLFRETLFRGEDGFAKIKEIDKNFIEMLYKLLQKHLETVSEEKLTVAAKALYSLLGFNIINFISDSTMSSKDLSISLMEQVNIIVDGLILSNRS